MKASRREGRFPLALLFAEAVQPVWRVEPVAPWKEVMPYDVANHPVRSAEIGELPSRRHNTPGAPRAVNDDIAYGAPGLQRRAA